MISKITEFRLKCNIILLTNDRGLEKDVLKLNNSNSTKGIKKIKVFRSDNKGIINAFKKRDRSDFLLGSMSNKKKIRSSNLTSLSDNKPAYIGNSSSIPLFSEIARGGEGKIYDLGNKVMKIYIRNQIDDNIEEKLNLLIEKSRKIHEKGITFPKEIVYNSSKECIGYTMDKVIGAITLSSYLREVKQNKYCITRKNLVEISEEVLRLAKVLHQNNIYVGDWNLKNILINPDTRKLYLIDTDSFQVDDYICPVGVEEFTDHEFLSLTGGRFNSHFRNERNEVFAIDTIIFQILMMGQKPYTRKENEANSYKNRRFPYRFSSDPKLEPSGNWKYIWHNLTYNLKESFWRTFTEGERYSLEWWEYIIRGYKIELDKGTVVNKLIPTTLKNREVS